MKLLIFYLGLVGAVAAQDITLVPAAEVRFLEATVNGVNYTGFKGPASLAGNVIYTLPSADGTSGQLLRTNGSGTLSWVSAAGTGDLVSTNNLSELTNASTARLNLGLGNVNNTSDATKTLTLEAATHTWAAAQTFGAGINVSVGNIALASDTVLTRETEAVFQLGVDAVGVINHILKGPDRITSDGAGGTLTIAAGRNRGSFDGGSLIFQTSAPAGAGVAGTLATRLSIDSQGEAEFWQNLLVDGDLEVFGSISSNTDITADDKVIAASFVGGIQALSGAGAANVTQLTTALTTTGADAITLANGTAGQLKIITQIVDGGDGTLDAATSTGWSTITFDAVGDSVTLQFHTTLGWMVVSNFNATVTP